MRRNFLLVYFQLMLRGVAQRARLLACLQAGKRGVENVAVILERLKSLGICSDVICDKKGEVSPDNACANDCTFVHGLQSSKSVTLMTVDVAGGKVSYDLVCIGLLFTIWCACHTASTLSSLFNLGWGKAIHGRVHPFNLCYNVVHTIRHHVGIDVTFVILATYLNLMMAKAGGDEYVRAGSPQLRGKDIQSAMGKVDSNTVAPQQYNIVILKLSRIRKDTCRAHFEI